MIYFTVLINKYLDFNMELKKAAFEHESDGGTNHM